MKTKILTGCRRTYERRTGRDKTLCNAWGNQGRITKPKQAKEDLFNQSQWAVLRNTVFDVIFRLKETEITSFCFTL